MSAGVRMSLEWGLAAAQELFRRWQLNPSSCLVCGSVRRRKSEIGDLDIIAPLPELRNADELYRTIDRTVIVPQEKVGLFIEQQTPKFVEAVSGLKPYFKSASLVVHLEGTDRASGQSRDFAIPVQINRYTEANRGWMEIYKTGPREFGVWFLVKWKERWGIPLGRDSKASHENHLRDNQGGIVPVRDEAEAFAKCGIAHIAPEDREEVAARAMAGWSQEQRERVS